MAQKISLTILSLVVLKHVPNWVDVKTVLRIDLGKKVFLYDSHIS